GVRKTSDAPVRWREIFANPVTWLFGVVFFLYPGAETCVGGWIGSYVSRMGPHEAALAPMMPAFFWAALTAGRGAGGLILNRLPEQRVLQVGYGLACVSIGLLLFSPALAKVILSAAVTGLCFATLYPITIARLTQRFGVQARNVGALM